MSLEDYQQKLEAFISKVPIVNSPTLVNKLTGAEQYGFVPSGTPGLPRTPYGTQAEKDAYTKRVEGAAVTNNADFTALTGLTHRGLVDNWKTGGILTSCNGFVGKAGAAMGAKGLGGFYMQEMLAKINKSHCWLTPASGLMPRYGDVFETRSQTPGKSYQNIHVAVSLQIEGSRWFTIEGGQGGPGAGVDKVARCVRPYSTEHLLGWVDMKLYISNAPPLPDWLVGAWIIHAGNKYYILNFNRYGEATEHVFMGLGVKTASPTVIDTGTVTLGAADTVTIRWNGEGGVETLTYDRWNSVPAILERCNGVASDGTSFTGAKL